FRYAGLSLEEHVVVDPGCFRPTDPMELLADASKAGRELGWNPQIKLHDLVKIMVDADMRAAGLEPRGEGDRILATKFPHRWWMVD
ncbi:MAG: GDP-mannose 4,6-dehydratase, partial [Chloroflexi bacterium]|nr:GDP-mannose 4,6-dehydratase [Chloroflexota bacterium]